MYLTPADENFTGVADDCFEEALFLIKEESGKRAACYVHLCDCDEYSPSGMAWDYIVGVWDGVCWQGDDHNLLWDAATAENVDFELPYDFGKCEIRLVDQRDPDAVRARDIMDDYDENRMFTEEEWEAATPV